MMIPAQTICMSSCRIPQPGTCLKSPVSLSPLRSRGSLKWASGFQKGRGYSTLAIKQASPFFSSAEGASDVEVPAKDTGVCYFTVHVVVHPEACPMPSQQTAERERGKPSFSEGTAQSVSGPGIFPGTKTVELMDPISPTKLASTVDDQLPPLLSMVIDGLPPLQQSKYVHEAEKCLHQYVKRYENAISLDSYCRVGLSSASYWHPGVISLDRLVAISFNYALLVLLDDLFFDSPNEFLQDQYGIRSIACGSPEKIQEYLDHLDAVFSQQVQPRNPAPLIETLMWESGRDMLELSNLEWFRNYIECVAKQQRACVASRAHIAQGHSLWFQDLESYTLMRAGNSGSDIPQLVIEFANDTYIPGILRANPYLENVTMATTIHIGFVNDVFSYHKESSQEQNPYNLITVLMECEGKPFVQTVYMAIGLVNTYAHTLIDLEAEAWNSTLQNHLQDIKAFIAGNVYFSFMDKRYRHPDSVFPELRDITSSWKILPRAKGLGL